MWSEQQALFSTRLKVILSHIPAMVEENDFVLDGVFQDEHGDYSVGAYIRNLPGTKHILRPHKGSVLFFKLWRFDLDDRDQFQENMTAELLAFVRVVAASVEYEDAHEYVRFT